MNESMRKVHPPALKQQVALEAIKEAKTYAEISSHYGVHVTQIKRWKQLALAALENGFSEVGVIKEKNQEELVATLFQEVGRLKIERDWLKKKLGIIETR